METTSFHLLLVSVTEPFIGFSGNSVQEFFTEICRTSASCYNNLSSESQAVRYLRVSMNICHYFPHLFPLGRKLVQGICTKFCREYRVSRKSAKNTDFHENLPRIEFHENLPSIQIFTKICKARPYFP